MRQNFKKLERQRWNGNKRKRLKDTRKRLKNIIDEKQNIIYVNFDI